MSARTKSKEHGYITRTGRQVVAPPRFEKEQIHKPSNRNYNFNTLAAKNKRRYVVFQDELVPTECWASPTNAKRRQTRSGRVVKPTYVFDERFKPRQSRIYIPMQSDMEGVEFQKGEEVHTNGWNVVGHSHKYYLAKVTKVSDDQNTLTVKFQTEWANSASGYVTKTLVRRGNGDAPWQAEGARGVKVRLDVWPTYVVVPFDIGPKKATSSRGTKVERARTGEN